MGKGEESSKGRQPSCILEPAGCASFLGILIFFLGFFGIFKSVIRNEDNEEYIYYAAWFRIAQTGEGGVVPSGKPHIHSYTYILYIHPIGEELTINHSDRQLICCAGQWRLPA